jgi:hypothetical protein
MSKNWWDMARQIESLEADFAAFAAKNSKSNDSTK